MNKNNRHYPSPILRKNEDGSYTCVLTKLDDTTPAGKYVSSAVAWECLPKLQELSTAGKLYGHFGQSHFFKMGREQMREAMGNAGLLTDDVCCKHTNLRIQSLREGENDRYFVSEVVPAGPKAVELLASLEADSHDFAFGLRGYMLASRPIAAQGVDRIIDIVSWDYIIPVHMAINKGN